MEEFTNYVRKSTEELIMTESELRSMICYCLLTITHQHNLANEYEEDIAKILIGFGFIEKTPASTSVSKSDK